MCFCAVIEPLDAESCRPQCTKEYCQANPTEICSARWLDKNVSYLSFTLVWCIFNRNLTFCRFVSLEKKACQGSCQHTSCSSCLLLKPPSCPQTCTPSDPSCLQRFGKCVHNHLRATHNRVCHNNLQVGGRKAVQSYDSNTDFSLRRAQRFRHYSHTFSSFSIE